MVLPIVIAAVVLIIGGIAAYYIARFMKGRLELELSRSSASSEELISGQVTLEAKKNIRGLLKVSLVAREKRTKRDSDGDESTEYVEVYRYDQVLEETRDFQAGFREAYPFDLLAPTAEEVRTGAAALKGMADKAGGGVMGGVLKAAAGAASFMSGRLYWHVESRLDADGVDLFTKEKCTVNLKG
ncbi:MAG: hypothetical protein KTR15_14755 [Phycisphaeraceae bacterium]|nr:hypothetical protein [Phycisphaeraceae bacterium]